MHFAPAKLHFACTRDEKYRMRHGSNVYAPLVEIIAFGIVESLYSPAGAKTHFATLLHNILLFFSIQVARLVSLVAVNTIYIQFENYSI